MAFLTVAVSGGQVALALLPVIAGAGGLGAVLAARSTNRRTNAEASKTHAEASDILQDTYAEALSDLRGQMQQLRDDARGARAEASEARAHAASAREEATRAVLAQQKAETRAAELEAALARAEQKAGEERHELRNDLMARTVELDLVRREATELAAKVKHLEGELAHVRDQLAQTERRRGAERRGD